ncbi:MAG: cellulase family glycosylhydrolase [Anaerolineae bacterium]|nr:cellulase family glycosylhydrolase [Anaerolineae bacterium]
MMKHTQSLFTAIILLLLAAACIPQEPIVVYVTPTLVESLLVSTPVPTLELPTVTVDLPPATETTATSTATRTSPSVIPTVIGSVIGEGYTLPPTSTPRPTNTPLPPTAGASSTPMPTNTPQGPLPTALPGLDPFQMGIQLDPTLNQQDWNQAVVDIQNLGVKWLKVQVAWKTLQPNGPGEITEDFRRLEIYLETAFNSGLDIMVSVAKAPNWARLSNQNEDGPPDNPQDLADFISLMLREFGSSIDAVEVWNEPNLLREWQGNLAFNGVGYMQLFEPSYATIRNYSQNMTIITAGLAPTGDNPTLGSRNDRSFLQEMYNAGLGQYTDVAIGIHPYGWGNAPDATCCDMNPEPGWDDDRHFFFKDNIDDFREIMVNSGHSGAQLWATEFGWASWDGFPGEAPQLWMTYVDECEQGNYSLRAFQIGQSLDYMGPMILWNLNFAMLAGLVESRDERAAYSVLTPLNPRERAAYWMIYDAVRPEEQLGSYSRCPGAG